MTENNKELPKISYDWHKLELAETAAEYLNQGENGIPLAKKSLELLLENINTPDSIISGLLTANPQILANTTKSYLETYNLYKEKKEKKVKDILEYYKKSHGIAPKNYTDKSILTEDELNQNYQNIVSEVKEADYIIDGKNHGRSSEEDVKSAENTIKKYEKIKTIITLLEQKRMSNLRNRVEDEWVKDIFRKYATNPADLNDYTQNSAAKEVAQ
jgi:hypothetical protein